MNRNQPTPYSAHACKVSRIVRLAGGDTMEVCEECGGRWLHIKGAPHPVALPPKKGDGQ